MLELIHYIVKMGTFVKKTTPWGCSIIVIGRMPVAICDKYLQALVETYDKQKRDQGTTEKASGSREKHTIQDSD